MKTRGVTVLRYTGITVITIMLLLLFFRNSLISFYLNRKVDRFNAAFQADLRISGIKIVGLETIRMTGLTLKPRQGDTLVKMDTVFASVSLLKLLEGRIALHDVQLTNTRFTFIRKDSITNYLFLLKGRISNADSTREPANFAAAADRLMGFVFDIIPRSLHLRNFKLEIRARDHQTNFRIDELALRDHFFHTLIRVNDENQEAGWVLAGRLDNGNRVAEFRLCSSDSTAVVLPFLQYKWNADIRFDTLSFSLAEKDVTDTLTCFAGFASVSGLRVNHEKIATQPVELDKLAIDYQFNIGHDYAEFDSASVITFNRLGFHPYVRYRPYPSKQITLHIHKPVFPAMDLFSSFPEGLFTNLNGFKVTGNLSWHLDFMVDLANPDSLKFETSLDRHQFNVISYGNSELTRLNSPFLYTAFDHDIPVRTFMVGQENSNFRPLTRISHFLQVAVLTSEDGGFYQHRGFLPDAFRESIITNIKEGRFARGGSTITMQLVKNVFLSRSKTIARKLEEALLVWLIENQGLCTKERMYEVYLNIIEWGPMIYGANEAARFYFNKDAAKLTLDESIFLASIIPRPKWFKYSFDENGHLRESNAGFYQLCTEKMLKKGWITQEEADKVIPDVDLKGPARLLLKKQDSIPADTIEKMVKW
ncbi:MAG: biosynthetic peptidoglycan transglycosylase [Bacteroidota bacterium]